MARKRSINRPFCMGHEAMGDIVEVGSGVQGLKVGQRVVLAPAARCGGTNEEARCKMCQQGWPLLCLHRDARVRKLAWGGGWSEEFVSDSSQLFPVPDGVSDEQAVLADPIACGLHAVLRRPPEAGDTVVVLGCGTIGLAIILALKALPTPVRIIAVYKHAYQAGLAKALGASVALSFRADDLYARLATELGTEILARGKGNRMLHDGAALVYDAVGSGESLHHALRWTRARGAVVLEGITPRPALTDCTPIWLKEIDVIGSHGYGNEVVDGRRIHAFELVLDWMREKRLVPDQLITHRHSLRDYKDAIRSAVNKSRSKATKVLLQMKSDD